MVVVVHKCLDGAMSRTLSDSDNNGRPINFLMSKNGVHQVSGSRRSKEEISGPSAH